MTKPASAPPPIATLVQLLQSGQFRELAVTAKNCTARWPGSAPVWHLLGLAYLNLGQAAEATAPLARALKLQPGDADLLEHQAIALMQSGRFREALQSYQRHLERSPDNIPALINAASLGNDLESFAAAEQHCRRVLQLAPLQPEAVFNLGRALRGQGHRDAAIEAFRTALQQTRNTPEAQNDIGLQLLELGRTAEAEEAFRQAISLAPGYAIAHANLGRALQAADRPDAAIAALQHALSLQPGLAAAGANLGNLFNTLRRFEAAEASCREALRLDPRLTPGYTNLGNSLFGQQRHSEAEAAYRSALKLDPGCTDALNNLGNLLQDRLRFDEAERCYRRIGSDDGHAVGQAMYCAAQVCDWSRRQQDEIALRRALAQGAADIGPFGVLGIAADDAPTLQLDCSRQFAVGQYGPSLARPPLVAPDSHPLRDRIRIGYLSADVYDHATMHLLAGVLEAHDRTGFATHLYAYGPTIRDAGRTRAEQSVEHFRDIAGLSDAAAAQCIMDDGIDLLIDLKGYTKDNRLGICALRPAPVLISWLGYPGTLGHPRLADYLIGDPVVSPLEHAAYFSETLALMPHAYQPNDRSRSIGAKPSRQDAGLPATGFVFCSFNQSYKFNAETFDLWCRLLREVPESVLWLLQPSPKAITNLRQEAERRGVAGKRLCFAPQRPLTEHLGRLQLADLALDTFPVNSHTTGSDALWAGVPMLTLIGKSFASRVGASLLTTLGLPELITRSQDEYLALALRIATSPDLHADLQESLRQKRLTSPLFDTAKTARDLERLLREIWSQHRDGRREIIRLEPLPS